MAKTHLRRAASFVGRATFIQNSRSKSAEEKALIHNELGAGRRHVIREFFGLNPEDEAAIVARIEVGLDQALKDETA